MQYSRPIHSAKSLLEMIVVIAIIGILAGLLVSAVQKTRSTAIRASCENNVRQLALAAQMYHGDRGHFPSGCEFRFKPQTGSQQNEGGFSWLAALLPYLEQSGELGRLAEEEYQSNPVGNEIHSVEQQSVLAFVCPVDGRTHIPFNGSLKLGETQYLKLGVTHYLGVAGTRIGRDDGMFDLGTIVRIADVTDGTSNTLMIGERPPGPGPSPNAYGTWYSGWGISLARYGVIFAAGVNDYVPSGAHNCVLDVSPFRPGGLDGCDAGQTSYSRSTPGERISPSPTDR